jgi:hypothetical protein
MGDAHNQTQDDGMLPEYDFFGGVRGKHAEAMGRGYQIVIHKSDGSTEVRAIAPQEGSALQRPDDYGNRNALRPHPARRSRHPMH